MTVLPYEFYQKRMGLYPVQEPAIDAAIVHAQHVFPEESCGVVIADTYYPMPNVHDTPKEEFRINTAAVFALVQEHGPLQAVIHSHPQAQPCPSKEDMQSQLDTAVPFGIVVLKNRQVQNVFFWGDTCPIAPAEGRPFIHGVYDCFATLRDYHRRTTGLVIPNLARADQWWDAKEDNDILEENYAKLGFTIPLDFTELRPGDGVMGKIVGMPRVNHCGVYIGNGLLLHHLFGSARKPRYSVIEPIYDWKKFITHCLRHKDLVQEPAQ